MKALLASKKQKQRRHAGAKKRGKAQKRKEFALSRRNFQQALSHLLQFGLQLAQKVTHDSLHKCTNS